MGEDWRFKPYYDKRIIIPLTTLDDPPADDCLLVILEPAELVLLRAMLGYCHRRSTFVDTYGAQGYYAPDNDQWDTVQALTARLEMKLMSGCDELLSKLDEMIAEMQNGTAAVASLEDDLACICEAVQGIDVDVTVNNVYNELLQDGTLTPDDPSPTDATPAENVEACAEAQLVWHFAWDFLNEVIQPAQSTTHDFLLPLAIAAIGAWIGGPAAAIPAGALGAAIEGAIDTWVRGQQENVRNELWAYKDEVICEAYEVLKESGSLAGAASAVHAVVDTMTLPNSDKVMLKVLMHSWVFAAVSRAYGNATAWATSRVDAGYCASTCGEDPIVGSDWIAMPYTPGVVDLDIDHPAGTYWQQECITQLVPAGFTIVGVFYQVTSKSGDCQLKPMRGTGDCIGWDMFTDTSANLGVGHYFSRKTGGWNDSECLSTVEPTATPQNYTPDQVTGAAWVNVALWLGWNCTGSADVDIRYLVYKGTTPPY